MIRRSLVVALLAATTAIVALAAQPATFVLTNGERVSGELTYKGGTDFTLNGRDYPSSSIALIAFVPGDPSAAELSELPNTNRPAEHEQHLFVMRDGSVVHGKLYHISPDGSTIQYDPLGTTGVGDRRTVSANDVARIYVMPRSARNVYANVMNTNAPAAAVATTGVAPAGSILVNANLPWTDTGITVKKGDRVSFGSAGQIAVGNGATATVDGSAQVPGRPGYPVPSAPAGALIARVGNNAPFGLGSSQQIVMPQAGRLYLGVNDDNFADNSGAFTVTIIR